MAAEISIITPVWNGMPYLKQCVESTLAQEFQEWEMLISDDGSTDGSREYLETLNDSRIRVFKQETNKGIFGNLNFIFSQASAPISQILCQDDYFTKPTSLTSIANYWQQAPSTIGFVRFNFDEVVQCSLTAYLRDISPSTLTPQNSDLFFFIFGNIPGNLSNVSLRTKLVATNGGFREDLPFAGDFEFWSRAASLINMGVEKQSVVYVRRHPNVASISLNKRGELIAQNSEIGKTLYSSIIQNSPNLLFSLKLLGTLNFDTLQRDAAVRKWFLGTKEYFRELERVSNLSPFTLGWLWRWILFWGTFGGRIGRTTLAKYIMKVYQLKSNSFGSL